MEGARKVLAAPFLFVGVLFMALGILIRFGLTKANVWIDQEVELITDLKGE